MNRRHFLRNTAVLGGLLGFVPGLLGKSKENRKNKNYLISYRSLDNKHFSVLYQRNTQNLKVGDIIYRGYCDYNGLFEITSIKKI